MQTPSSTADRTPAAGAEPLPQRPASDLPPDIEAAFFHTLLEGLDDAVVFLDAEMKILLWSPAAERMTGIPAAVACQQTWTPELVGLREAQGAVVTAERCPLRAALRAGARLRQLLSLQSRDGHRISVDARLVPVTTHSAGAVGATLILHDASSRVTLAERVQALHERATRDPLTGVANRAEFDRVLKQFIDTHLEQGRPCSLIICDLDRFKRINDVYGHQAGDEALVCFAALLRRGSRSADLVARYGGEEFVMLCADCDHRSATTRAEEIRRELADIPQASLDGECLTASFGVTGVQAGDSPQTMLRRADRALLQAKEAGRNQVVQLGASIDAAGEGEAATGWFVWRHPAPTEPLIEKQLLTAVPLKVAVEKLRGFVADHQAEIFAIDDHRLRLQIAGQHGSLLRRASDRPVPFEIEVTFSESDSSQPQPAAFMRRGTLVNVSIRPLRHRNRRRAEVLERARQLLRGLQAYLMAQDLLDSQ